MDNRDFVDRSSEEFAAIAPVPNGSSYVNNGAQPRGDEAPHPQPRPLANEPSPIADGVMQSDVCSRWFTLVGCKTDTGVDRNQHPTYTIEAKHSISASVFFLLLLRSDRAKGCLGICGILEKEVHPRGGTCPSAQEAV